MSGFRPEPTVAVRRSAFTLWLHGARDDLVLMTDAATLAYRYRLPEREVEAALLARQGVLRRQRAMSQ